MKFGLTFQRVKKDGMCLFCVGIIKKDKGFPSCFGQIKAGQQNNQSRNEKSYRTTRVLQESHDGRWEGKTVVNSLVFMSAASIVSSFLRSTLNKKFKWNNDKNKQKKLIKTVLRDTT